MLLRMYVQHFGLEHAPFSIAPDPRFLFLSAHHREALAHLLYGLEAGGGFVVLTGDIGAGKTTVCRCFLEQVPADCQVAYVFNPRLSAVELLAEVCQEFGVDLPPAPPGGPSATSVKAWVDPLNRFLLASHAAGRNSVLVIDEAQQLSSEVLEQLRLLTNLETNERKLLQIILIGQPELGEMLARPGLEQLAQRVIARYHLGPLDVADTGGYLQHRLQVAGLRGPSPIGPALWRRIHRHSAGLPRRINLVCDRALLGAYSQGLAEVDRRTLAQAMREVPAARAARRLGEWPRGPWVWGLGAGLGALMLLLVGWLSLRDDGWLAQTTAGRGGPVIEDRETGDRPDLAVAPVRASVARDAVPTIPLTNAQPVADAAALAALVEPLADESQARRALAERWGLSLPEGPPCTVGMRAGLVCHEVVGGLALLRQLDRPGLLRLSGSSDSGPRWVELQALGDQAAVIRIAETSYRVPLPVLAQAWRGDFLTWWRRPEVHPGTVTRPLPAALVDWLGIHLPVRPGGDEDTLEMRLKAFQLSEGLQPDGRPGPLTMMALNRRIGVDEPALPGTQP